MGKKKTKAPDQHRSGFMIRLPEAYRAALTELKRTTRRPFTTEIQVALDEHFKKNGITIPQENQGN